MKARKSLTAVGAALVVATIGTPAMAAGFDWDPGVCGDAAKTSAELIELSEHLRCDTATHWIADETVDPPIYVDPIWEKAGSGDRGCEVHESLADKLWVEPPRNEGNTDKKGKGQGKVAEGAAQKVDDGKYDEAVTKLRELQTAIDKSKENRGFSDGGKEAAWLLSNGLLNLVMYEAIPCVDDLLQ